MGLRPVENVWVRLTTASAQCLRLSERFFLLFFPGHYLHTRVYAQKQPVPQRPPPEFSQAEHVLEYSANDCFTPTRCNSGIVHRRHRIILATRNSAIADKSRDAFVQYADLRKHVSLNQITFICFSSLYS